MAIIFYIFHCQNYITSPLLLPVLNVFPHGGKKIGSKSESCSFSAALLQVVVVHNFLPGKFGCYIFLHKGNIHKQPVFGLYLLTHTRLASHCVWDYSQ